MYISTGIDNLGYSEGKWNDANKSVEYTGAAVDPVSGKELKIRQIIKTVDDYTEIMEIFTTRDDNEFKSMEIKMTPENGIKPSIFCIITQAEKSAFFIFNG